jgi:branched-chain amino acid transport system ATP-binding protein
MSLLTVHQLTKRFGGITAVNEASFTVQPGTITGLIGPNGAGKSTLFDLLSGRQKPTAGHVWFDDREITGWAPHRTAAAGLARTFQLMRGFSSGTVRDNIQAAAYLRHHRRADALAVADEICARYGLADVAEQRVGTLTGATRKRLEIARAMATHPKLLLLDEVLSGLTPAETQTAVALIRHIRDVGVTVLLVEHVMDVVMSLCETVVVLDQGAVIFTGSVGAAVTTSAVIDAYLGT